MLSQSTLQNPDLTPFPPVSLPGSPCCSAPRLPRSTPGKTNPRIRDCRGEVCVSVSGLLVSAQHPRSPLVRRSHKRCQFLLFFAPSGLHFLLSTSTKDCVSVCGHVWDRLCVLSVSEWECVCVCENAFVLQDGDSMSHWQAAGQAALCALHYCCDDWNRLRGGVAFCATHKHINMPPPTAVSQFTLTNTS